MDYLSKIKTKRWFICASKRFEECVCVHLHIIPSNQLSFNWIQLTQMIHNQRVFGPQVQPYQLMEFKTHFPFHPLSTNSLLLHPYVFDRDWAFHQSRISDNNQVASPELKQIERARPLCLRHECQKKFGIGKCSEDELAWIASLYIGIS